VTWLADHGRPSQRPVSGTIKRTLRGMSGHGMYGKAASRADVVMAQVPLAPVCKSPARDGALPLSLSSAESVC
jgi:hypothetical protein